ncbi:MAG: hypothetical protein GVY35_02440 [Bacteroidetes bacterium]|jgi:predicted transposase|nr:hypothetical protein [Bacteroidota bacterium]
MTITIKCKLDLTEGQRSAIDNTMEAFASACNDALDVGREAGTTSNVKIHDRCYYDLREDHGLPANLAVRAIARAAGTLKVKERPHSTVPQLQGGRLVDQSLHYPRQAKADRPRPWGLPAGSLERSKAEKCGRIQKAH